MTHTEYMRKYRKTVKGKEYVSAYSKLPKAKNSNRKNLYKKYGITLQEYESIFKEQNGVCAICGKSSDRKLAVDHDHETGKIRGLLCLNCNCAMGFVEDNFYRIMQMAGYLFHRG